MIEIPQNKEYLIYCQNIITWFKRGIILAFLICIVRMVFICILGYMNPSTDSYNTNTQPFRNDITDRYGNVLALNVPSSSVYVKPNKIKPENKKFVIHALSTALELPLDYVSKIVNSNSSFVWVKRNISDNQELTLRYYGSLDIYFEKSQLRFYPYENLFSHVVGMTDIDNVGISGVEKSLNKEIYKHDIQLSLDLRIQNILHDALQTALIKNQAKYAYGMVVDPNTSEVLAMVSLPDYNPNDRANINVDHMFNYPTQGVYEPGSIVKPLSVAMALDSGAASIYDTYDVSIPIVKNSFVITDFDYIDKVITLPEVLMYSSNIGTSMLIRRVGPALQESYLEKFGILKESTLEIAEKTKPLVPKKFTDLNSMTISYGYGLAMTQANYINAFSSVVNGGVYRPLTLLKKNPSNAEEGVRVISEQASAYLRAMLRLVVAKGFGSKADVIGYDVGGKTGSAEKSIKGVYYKNKSIASFAAFFPYYKPKYAIVLTVQEPKRVAYNHYVITGGYLSAPVMNEVISKMALALGISKNQVPDTLEIDKTNQSQLVEYTKNSPIK